MTIKLILRRDFLQNVKVVIKREQIRVTRLLNEGKIEKLDYVEENTAAKIEEPVCSEEDSEDGRRTDRATMYRH